MRKLIRRLLRFGLKKASAKKKKVKTFLKKQVTPREKKVLNKFIAQAKVGEKRLAAYTKKKVKAGIKKAKPAVKRAVKEAAAKAKRTAKRQAKRQIKRIVGKAYQKTRSW